MPDQPADPPAATPRPARPAPSPDPVFVALADPTRRRMLERLADGPATITELHAGQPGRPVQPITRQAISKHLRVLTEAGVVTDRKVGRERRFTLAPETLGAATGWLATIERRWDARIAALRGLVEGPPDPGDEPDGHDERAPGPGDPGDPGDRA